MGIKIRSNEKCSRSRKKWATGWDTGVEVPKVIVLTFLTKILITCLLK